MVFCDFASPLGSLWAPLDTSFVHLWAPLGSICNKVASGVPKQALLGVFWRPFGRVLHDIYRDLGCDLNIPSSGMP